MTASATCVRPTLLGFCQVTYPGDDPSGSVIAGLGASRPERAGLLGFLSGRKRRTKTELPSPLSHPPAEMGDNVPHFRPL